MTVKIETGNPSGRRTRAVLRTLSLGLAAGALLTGCGVVYQPTYAPSAQSLLVKDDERFPYDLQIVDLTIASAQEANVRWPYRPRNVPAGLLGPVSEAPGAGYRSGPLARATGPVAAYATSQGRPDLPQDEADSYKIGRGDILLIANVAGDNDASDSQLSTTYRVDQRGRVFVPQLDYIPVAGKDIEEIRVDVQERMQRVFISPVPLVRMAENGFLSQNYSITGSSIRPVTAPVTMQPVTLRNALIAVAATEGNIIYDEAKIELVRDGVTYVVPYSDISFEGEGSQTIMKDGDQVIIRDNQGSQARQAQLQRTLEAVNIDNQQLDLQRQQITASEQQRRLTEQQLALSRNSDSRDAENLRLAQERLALESEAARRAQEAARLAEQASLRADEELRLAREREARDSRNLELQQLREQREDRAFELQRLREQREADAFELQRLRERREDETLRLQVQRSDREQAAFELDRARSAREQATLELQRAREDRERSSLEFEERRLAQAQAEFEIRQGQFDLAQQDQILRERADARGRDTLEISRLTTREQLGALERDHVYVSGEVGETLRMPMPYGSSLSLADALYQAKGIDRVTGDPGGVHVVRTDNSDSVRAKVYIFKLDAANLANLSAATVFKMRPEDVLYVTPQPVTNWNRVLTQLLGGTNALVGAASRGAL